MTHPILCCHGWWSYIRKLLIVQQRKRDTITDKVGHECQLKMHSVVSKGVGDASSSVWITTSPTFPMLWLHVCFYTTCVKCSEIIALMSGYTTRPQQQHKPAVSLPASVELVPLSFVMLSRTLLVAEDIKCMYTYGTWHGKLTFFQTRSVGLPKAATQQYADAHAAMHGSLAQECADALRIYAMWSLQISVKAYALDPIQVMAAEAVSLQSCYRWGALPIGQPFAKPLHT